VRYRVNSHGRGGSVAVEPATIRRVAVTIVIRHLAETIGMAESIAIDGTTLTDRVVLLGVADLAGRDGTPAHAVFVCQRPDAAVVRSFEAIDPEFTEALRDAVTTGVSVHGLSIAVDLPVYHLADPDVPVIVE
jgi:hypothetical protein